MKDKKGVDVKEGDRVLVPMIVRHLRTHEVGEKLNYKIWNTATLETVDPVFGTEEHGVMHVDTMQLEVVPA